MHVPRSHFCLVPDARFRAPDRVDFGGGSFRYQRSGLRGRRILAAQLQRLSDEPVEARSMGGLDRSILTVATLEHCGPIGFRAGWRGAVEYNEVDQLIMVDLGEDQLLAARVEIVTGDALVTDDEEKTFARLQGVTKSIETVGREVLESVKKVSPSKAVVELGFGLALEQGQLVALLGKAKGEATIKVTLEWSATRSGAS